MSSCVPHVTGNAVWLLRVETYESGDASKKATYAELIGGKRFDMPIQRGATRKPQREWTVLGTSVPRVEMADLVTAKYFKHYERDRSAAEA